MEIGVWPSCTCINKYYCCVWWFFHGGTLTCEVFSFICCGILSQIFTTFVLIKESYMLLVQCCHWSNLQFFQNCQILLGTISTFEFPFRTYVWTLCTILLMMDVLDFILSTIFLVQCNSSLSYPFAQTHINFLTKVLKKMNFIEYSQRDSPTSFKKANDNHVRGYNCRRLCLDPTSNLSTNSCKNGLQFNETY